MNFHPAHDDTNNCTVRALAATFQRPLEEIYDELAKRGRRHGQGLKPSVYRQAIKDLAPRYGFDVWAIDARTEYGATVKTAAPRILARDERVILQTAGHTLAVCDGRVHDWSDGRQLRIRPKNVDPSYRLTRTTDALRQREAAIAEQRKPTDKYAWHGMVVILRKQGMTYAQIRSELNDRCSVARIGEICRKHGV